MKINSELVSPCQGEDINLILRCCKGNYKLNNLNTKMSGIIFYPDILVSIWINCFKFLSKKRIGIGKYENRELREFFKIWDNSLDITDCVCNYEGKFYAKTSTGKEEILLKECKMPFKTKQR